ncbi:hypothetical protein PM082_009584 [Marasmius tenuissimus]|nr:hypothetical protein PM082_009584 [Marasmius tenuissimus]
MPINEDKGNQGNGFFVRATRKSGYKYESSKLSSNNGNTGKEQVGEKDRSLPQKNDAISTHNSDPPQGQHLTKSPPPNEMAIPKPNLRAANYTPSHANAYPYDKITKVTQTPPVQKPAGFSIPFTDQSYPCPYISTKELIRNLADLKRSLINKD